MTIADAVGTTESVETMWNSVMMEDVKWPYRAEGSYEDQDYLNCVAEVKPAGAFAWNYSVGQDLRHFHRLEQLEQLEQLEAAEEQRRMNYADWNGRDDTQDSFATFHSTTGEEEAAASAAAVQPAEAEHFFRTCSQSQSGFFLFLVSCFLFLFSFSFFFLVSLLLLLLVMFSLDFSILFLMGEGGVQSWLRSAPSIVVDWHEMSPSPRRCGVTNCN